MSQRILSLVATVLLVAGGGVTTARGLQQPGAASPRAQLAARACLNCHVLVHGSNHPAGAKFQR